MIFSYCIVHSCILQGTLLENFVTKTPEDFNAFMRLESAPVKEEEEAPKREAYRYAKVYNCS